MNSSKANVEKLLRPSSLLLLLVLSACAVGPDYVAPNTEMPKTFNSELSQGMSHGEADVATWWTRLEDPQLDSLVTRALQQNLELEEALHRIQESRALRGNIDKNYLPTVNIGASYERSRLSSETVNGAFISGDIDLYRAESTVSWELDFWGRNQRRAEAADADIGSQVEDARGIIVTVVTDTVLNYVDYLNLSERIRIAEKNLRLQEQAVALAAGRLAANLVTALDVAEAKTNLETTRSVIPDLRIARRVAKNRICVLLGIRPGDLDDELKTTTPVPTPELAVAIGVPADLVRRRPDIRSAERRLAAATARIGVAEAELYPTLSLNGSFGVQADDVASLAAGGARGFTLGPSIQWNVFDRGRLFNEIAAADERAKQASVSYDRTVLLALEEVENSLVQFVRGQERRRILEDAVTSSQRAVTLSEAQYKQGLVSFQSVLDAQSRLFALEDDLAMRRAGVTRDLVTIFKALGGGWEANDIALIKNEERGEKK